MDYDDDVQAMAQLPHPRMLQAHTGRDGRIIHQRDYYDLWGDIFNGIPGFRRLYRRFMRRYFG